MLHSKHIEIPANTTESAAVITRFRVNMGVLYRVWVTFPAGCAGLVKFRMFHEGHPILPVEKDAYIRGDDFVFVYPLMVEINTQPEQITVEAWNEDDVWEHTLDFQLLVINKKWIMPVGAYEGILAALKSIFSSRRWQ